MFHKFNLTAKVILFAAAAVVLTTCAIYAAVSYKLQSELETRQRMESEQHLRTLALLFSAHVPGAEVEWKGLRVARVTTPTLDGFSGNEIVDQAVAYSGGNATIFSFEPSVGQFVRRSTTVTKEDGERATGTVLAPDSPAQKPTRSGQAYYGMTRLFGRHFYTAYHPTFDATGKVNGILYVGVPIELYRSAQAKTMGALAVAACLIAMLACAIIGVLASRLFRPLTTLSRRIEALAAGELEAPVRAERRRDEVGALARAVETLRLSGVRARILEKERSEAADAAMARRAELDDAISSFRASVSEQVRKLAANTAKLRSRAGEMSSASEDAEQAVDVADRGSKESSANTRMVADAAERLYTSIQEIGGRVEHARELASTAFTESKIVDDQIGSLAEAASQIGAIVSLIHSIADQTNLLALNAAIEAARAGEAGRGFAVVATEVKVLAGQTASATKDIAAQIEGVQTSTESAVAAIRKMTARMSAIDEATGAIADAVVAQGAATCEISRNVADTAKGSNEIAHGLSIVSGAASRTSDTASDVTRAAGSVDDVVAALRDEIESFLHRVAV